MAYLGVAAFVVILGCVSLLTVLFYQNSKDVFIDNFKEKLVLTGDVIQSELNTVSKEEFVNTDFLTKNYAIAAYVSGGSEGFEAETLSSIRTYANTTDHILNVALFTKDGKFIMDAKDAAVEDLDSELAKRLYMETGILTNKEINNEGHTIAWYYQPIINEYGSVGGFIGKQMDETQLYAFLSEKNLMDSASGTLFILDNENRIIISKDSDMNGGQIEEPFIIDTMKTLKEAEDEENISDIVSAYTDSTTQSKRLFYMGYFPQWDMTALVTIDESEIMAPINDMVKKSVVVAGIMLIVALGITFVITRYMTKPIHQISELLIKTKELDFRDNSKYQSLKKNRTELGLIAIAVFDLVDVLKGVTVELSEYSEQIHEEAVAMEGSITRISEGSLNNSASTEELSASMDEMSASAEEVSATTVEVAEIIHDVDQATTDTQGLSKEIVEEK